MSALPSFYEIDGGAFAPTGLGRSPWNSEAQLGVALAGLAAEVIETHAGGAGLFAARLTIDFLGAVPLVPLTPRLTLLRTGARVQIVQAELLQGERCWVRAEAMYVREAPSPPFEAPPTHPLPADADARDTRSGHWVRTCRIAGDYAVPGPGSMWVKPMGEIVAGRPLAPLAAIAMVSDFGTAVAPLFAPREYATPNLDIAIRLTRPALPGWLLVDATSESAGNGTALVTSRLADTQGMIGTAHQSLFLTAL